MSPISMTLLDRGDMTVQAIVQQVVNEPVSSDAMGLEPRKSSDVSKILQLVKKVVDMYVKQSHISMLQVCGRYPSGTS